MCGTVRKQARLGDSLFKVGDKHRREDNFKCAQVVLELAGNHGGLHM
jgi:hypothetical protein